MNEKLSIISDFRTLELTGTTHGTADTSRKFRHGKDTVPQAHFILEGDVYIPFGGMGPTDIDVRSRLTNHQFRILLVY